MDRAKSGLIRKVLIKERGAEISANIGRLPPYFLIGNLETCLNGGDEIHRPVGKGKMWCICTGLIAQAPVFTVQATSRSSQYRGAFIAALPIEK